MPWGSCGSPPADAGGEAEGEEEEGRGGGPVRGGGWGGRTRATRLPPVRVRIVPPVRAARRRPRPVLRRGPEHPPRWAFEDEEEEEDDDALLALEEDGGGAYAAPKNFNETMEEMADVAISVGIMERWT